MLGLVRSKQDDLVSIQWSSRDADGQRALDTLLELAGFTKSIEPDLGSGSNFEQVKRAPMV